VKVDGDDRYVMVLHTNQVTQLRTNTSTGQWLDIQKAAMTGDGSKDNPILTGALGVYNGVILHESTRITHGVTRPPARRSPRPPRGPAGRPAGAIGFGQGLLVRELRLERRAVRLRQPTRRRGRLHLRPEEAAVQLRGLRLRSSDGHLHP
jgi:hypothetical protein